LGTLCFSYGGNYVYPEIYHEMTNKKQFTRVLAVSIAIISTLYLATGIAGYSTYGNQAVSPIFINLPNGLLKKSSVVIITSHVLFACPMLFQTICLDLERAYKAKTLMQQNTLRFLVVLFAGSISASLPFFSDLMALIGAVSNTMLIFILPVLFNFYLGKTNTTTTYILGLLIMLTGLVGGTLGTYDAVKALYIDIKEYGYF
jgi:amino acid permease